MKLSEQLETVVSESVKSMSKTMEVWLKGVFEAGGSRAIPKKTFEGLSSRGYVEGGKEANFLLIGATGQVNATLTPKGKERAIELFRAEHEERLRNNETSERIPRLLKKFGVPGF